MQSFRRTHLVLSAVLIALSACAHKDPKRPEEKTEAPPVSMNPAPDAGASMETKQVAAESNAPFSTEVRFQKRSSTLSRESAGRLAKILGEALKVGAVDEIDAYVWSDQEYPGQQAKKLPPKEHDLAQSRGQMIQSYFENQKPELKGKVKIITMTEQPEGLAKTLNLGETRDKKMFAESGINTTDKNKKAAPKASRAAVMILLKK
jgi:hypothetical protein